MNLPSVGSLMRMALSMAGVGGAVALASNAIDGAQEEAVGVDTLQRTLNDLGMDFESLRNATREAGDGLLTTYQETVKLASQFAKISNINRSDELMEQVRTATGFSRSFGLEPESSNPVFAQMRWLGVTGERGMDEKELATLFADAIASGGMWGKADEVIRAIARWTEGAERVSVLTPNVAGYAGLQAQMNASSMPGLHGAAGEALIAQIDAAIRRGGAFGEAGQNFMWRSMIRPGSIDPFQMKYLQEGGAFASRASEFGRLDKRYAGFLPGNSRNGRTNFELVKTELDHYYQGKSPFMKWDAMSNLLGISMHQSMALDNLPRTNFGALGKLLGRNRIDLKDLNPTGIKDLAQIASADTHGLETIRASFLKRGNITPDDVSRLQSQSGEGLRGALADVAARLGRDKNIGTESLQATKDMKNALTSLGDNLLPLTTEIKEVLVSGFQAVDSIVEMLAKRFGYDPRGLAMTRQQGLVDSQHYQRSTLGGAPTAHVGNVGEQFDNSRFGPAYLRGLRPAKLTAEQRRLQAEAEKRFGLPAGLLHATVSAESGGNAHAISKTGARGWYQFMPETARRFGVTDPSDFRSSTIGAAKYYQSLLKRYAGRPNQLDLAIAAYNAGEGTTDQALRAHGGIPRNAETLAHVPKVKTLMMMQDLAERPGGAPTRFQVTGSKRRAFTDDRQPLAMPEGAAPPTAGVGPNAMTLNVEVSGILKDHRGQVVGELAAPQTRVPLARPWGTSK